MESRFIRPGDIERCLVLWSLSWIHRVSKRAGRCPLSKRSALIASAGFICVFFLVSQAGHTLPRDRIADKQRYRGGRGHTPESWLALQDASPPQPVRTGDTAATWAPNVVYITLKAKRSKPSVIRGTLRPKSRRKQNLIKPAPGFSDAGGIGQGDPRHAKTPRRAYEDQGGAQKLGRMEDTSLKRRVPQDTHARPGSIRMYSQSAPPWFSTADMDALRFLSGSAVAGVSDISLPGHPPLLLFQGTAFVSGTPPGDTHRETGGEAPVCHGRCGLIKRPVDLSEVFAFHLDRVLGLNRSVPAVSRRFDFYQDSRACAVLLWDPSLAPAVRLTWGSYQRALGHQCWHRGVAPRAEWGCPTIHHSEWSKLALFDFLLQVYDRLDRNCCGFKPRREDLCVEKGLHRECADQDSVDLVHIVHRQGDPGRLVFIDNKGYFDRDESNLDFKLLEGIKELPESAIAVLRSRRLREKLLQSLFLDEAYWESQGGRQGIEKLIDVVERRAKVLLTYINAHGIKLAPMGN